MNPTPNQITECDDEKQLWHWVAIYCMGWELVKDDTPSPFGIKDRPYWNNFNDPIDAGCYDDEWMITAPTDFGKSRCWDLIIKYNLIVDSHFSGANYVHYEDKNNENAYVDNETDLQIAVVKAALLCAIGD